MESSQFDFSYPVLYKTISLTTYRKSIRNVPTPIDFTVKNGKLYVNTAGNSHKVRCIIFMPSAKIAPYTFRGKIFGAKINVISRLLPKNENKKLIQCFNKKWNTFTFKKFRLFGKLIFWRKPAERVMLEFAVNTHQKTILEDE